MLFTFILYNLNSFYFRFSLTIAFNISRFTCEIVSELEPNREFQLKMPRPKNDLFSSNFLEPSLKILNLDSFN